MPLMAVVDNLDDVEEGQKGLYIEKKFRTRSTIGRDGKEVPGQEVSKFVLDLTVFDDHPNVIALHNAHLRTKDSNTKLKTELESLKTKFAGLPEDFTIEQYETLKLAAEAADAGAKDGETEEEKRARLAKGEAALRLAEQKLERLTSTHKVDLEKKDHLIKSLNDYINKLLIDEGLTRALAENGVKPNFMKAAKAMLRENCKVVGEGDERRAVYETSDIGEVDLPKFVKDWSSGEEGKEFVSKPKGGGADGGDQGNKALNGKNPFAKKVEDGYNLTEASKIVRDDPVKARQLAKSAGLTDAEIARQYPSIAA